MSDFPSTKVKQAWRILRYRNKNIENFGLYHKLRHLSDIFALKLWKRNIVME